MIPTISQERLTQVFLELTAVSSESLDERKAADLLTQKLHELGFSVVEDKNSPIDKSAPAIRSIPKKFPNKIPKLGIVKKEIIKV